MTPIDTLIAWFNGLPTEIKQDAAFIIFGTVPQELVPDFFTEEAPDSKFVERVQRWGQGMPSQHVGAVLMVAAAIDLLLLKRSSEGDWSETRRFMEHLKQVAPTPGLKKHAENTLEQLPERAAMWMEASAQWGQLRENELSLSSLHSWMMNQR